MLSGKNLLRYSSRNLAFEMSLGKRGGLDQREYQIKTFVQIEVKKIYFQSHKFTFVLVSNFCKV